MLFRSPSSSQKDPADQLRPACKWISQTLPADHRKLYGWLLADKLTHAKRESMALKAQLEASRIAYDDLLAAFEKSIYMPAVVDRRDLFEKTRDKNNG